MTYIFLYAPHVSRVLHPVLYPVHLYLNRTLLHLRSNQTSSIQRNSRPCNPRSSSATQKQTRTRHIGRTPNPAKWYPTLNLLPEVLQCLLHHLTLKWAACEHVARDMPVPEMRGEHAR